MILEFMTIPKEPVRGMEGRLHRALRRAGGKRLPDEGIWKIYRFPRHTCADDLETLPVWRCVSDFACFTLDTWLQHDPERKKTLDNHE